MKLLGATAQTAAWHTALNGLAGTSRRGVVYGGPDLLPRVWTPGAAGWTESLTTAPEAWGTGYSALTADDSLAVHLGQTYSPTGTTLPAFGSQKTILIAGQSNAGFVTEPKLGAYATMVVKSYLGATSLYTDWVPGGTLYNAAVQACYAATPQEIWWVQGETDAANQTAANAYQVKLAELIAAFRVSFSNATLRVRVAVLHIGNQGTYRDTVRAAQNAVCDADPYADAFSEDGYALGADQLHLTAAAGTQMGVDLGDLYIATL